MHRNWLSAGNGDGTSGLPLLCLPYAGGGVWIFREWPKLIGDGIDVCPLHLPGRGRRLREKAFTCVKDMANAMAEELAPVLDRPFALFGHSAGALAAFELSRRLAADGRDLPVHLFISSRRAPSASGDDRREMTFRLPDDEFLDELEHRYGAAPHDLRNNPEMLQLVLPSLRADMEIHETYEYRPGPPLSCPITVFGGRNDRCIEPAHLEAWQRETTGVFRVARFAGDHFYLHDCEAELTREIRRDLTPHIR